MLRNILTFAVLLFVAIVIAMFIVALFGPVVASWATLILGVGVAVGTFKVWRE